MKTKRPPAETYLDSTRRRLCPVCQKVSYSREGIHPQCAQLQADNRRIERLKAAKALKQRSEQSTNGSTSSWYRPCPRCKAAVHVRKEVCACGYQLVNKRPVAKK